MAFHTRSLFHCFIGSLILFLTACSSTPYKQFADVKPGMEKTDVIERIGSPSRSAREEGVDVWKYRFFEDNHWIEKVVIFKNGVVSYSGDPLSDEKVMGDKLANPQTAPAGGTFKKVD